MKASLMTSLVLGLISAFISITFLTMMLASYAGAEDTTGLKFLVLLWIIFVSPFIFGLTAASLVTAFKQPHLIEEMEFAQYGVAAKIVSVLSAVLLIPPLFLL